MIIRIDKPKHSRKGTHGWQVRINYDKHTKMFSDKKLGGRRKAMAAARKYKKEYIKNNPPPNADTGIRLKCQRNNKSGVNGVHHTYSYSSNPKKRGIKQWYWAASYKNDEGKRQMKRFLDSTFGYQEAKRMAIEFRRNWERSHGINTEVIRRRIP